MTWLTFVFILEAGFQSQSELMYTEPNFDTLSAGYQIDSPYVLLGIEGIFFDFLALGGSAQIFVADTNSWMYAPYDTRFQFYLRGDFRIAPRVLLTMGWEHECFHPALSWERPDVGFLYGGGDKIYARITASTKGERL
jgi:hypothetical protein